MLGAEMDEGAGTALLKYNYESAPFPWVFGFWVFEPHSLHIRNIRPVP